jgi:hypothetical protein
MVTCETIDAGSISGNLLHIQCVSTVFWYPQIDLLIFSDSGFHERSHVTQEHIYEAIMSLKVYILKTVTLGIAYYC